MAHKEDKDIYQGRGWAERSGQEEWVGRIGWRCGGLEEGGGGRQCMEGHGRVKGINAGIGGSFSSSLVAGRLVSATR